jgi:hypothetical protein
MNGGDEEDFMSLAQSEGSSAKNKPEIPSSCVVCSREELWGKNNKSEMPRQD